MQVRSYGCSSATRVAVNLSKPFITRTGNVLSSNYPTGNQWYFNGTPIAGATGQTIAPIESGNYQVSVTINGSCASLSDNFAFALIAAHPDNSDIGLALFPVPASGTLNVVLTAKAAGDLNMSFINSAGQVDYTETRTISAGSYSTVVNVSGLASGTYVLKLTIGGSTYSKKVIIIR